MLQPSKFLKILNQELLTKFTFSNAGIHIRQPEVILCLFYGLRLMSGVQQGYSQLRFTVFLTAPQFYCPSTLTYTPPGNNQQRAEDPWEMRQSNMHLLKVYISNPLLASPSYPADRSTLFTKESFFQK